MRAGKFLAGAALLLSAAAQAQFNEPNPVPPAEADIILEDARIYTPDGWASALAIADGAIVAIGAEADVAPHRAAGTRVIDLDGKMVMPGSRRVGGEVLK